MRIVIAGGIGSGKSEVVEILRNMNRKVISADDVNRSLLEDPKYLKRLNKLFPTCFEDGKLIKNKLAEIIYNDKYARDKLNAYAHPVIMDKIAEATVDGVWFIEVPLMKYEYLNIVDSMWFVRAPYDERIARIVRRDGISVEEAVRRIKVQYEYNGIENHATDIIDNDGDKTSLKSKVESLCQKLKESQQSL